MSVLGRKETFFLWFVATYCAWLGACVRITPLVCSCNYSNDWSLKILFCNNKNCHLPFDVLVCLFIITCAVLCAPFSIIFLYQVLEIQTDLLDGPNRLLFQNLRTCLFGVWGFCMVKWQPYRTKTALQEGL